jgi:hypothetical protein
MRTNWRSAGRATLAAAGLALATLAGPALTEEVTRNGFALAPASIPVDEILEGGPPRDGIPALSDPQTVAAEGAPYADDDTVIGVVQGGEARAYPIAILNWHELVNDTLGGRPVLVSFCPLCGTGIVFDRSIDGQVRSFGVSGLLYRSDLLLYDRETESLWSQIAASAVTGPANGKRLRVLRSSLMPWGRWKEKHPDTSVLSLETGHRRDYGRSPYGDYALSNRVLFSVKPDPRYHPKMPTIGMRILQGGARAYPASEILKAGGRVEGEFEGRPVAIAYDPDEQVFTVEAPPDVDVIEGYWFAWVAFHPETQVFTAASDRSGEP